MKIAYASRDGQGPSFEIEADRHGSYTIRQDGKVVKRVTALTQYAGRPRWGSKKLELRAIEDAKAAAEALRLPAP
ncbi:hypothetical protein [Caenimonas aquaedulcis]|uniref:Uncharacterized protein n=1 Tax=Caenimonas aquaedulcis TaxID=2793270 RepID=A0A931H8T6_9BURK|nr:hypothetical protein [Caenimonas aquaedulcis]MBG9390658.1 hypothetical protein [Caenimonas aquaedulcis]